MYYAICQMEIIIIIILLSLFFNQYFPSLKICERKFFIFQNVLYFSYSIIHKKE